MQGRLSRLDTLFSWTYLIEAGVTMVPVSLFPAYPALIGMVHLGALPGSPGFAGSLQEVIDYAAADARAIEKGGADGLMIENFFD